MDAMSRLPLAPLFVLAIAIAPPASGTLIPVGTSQANDVIINVNFTGSTPPPPYLFVDTFAFFTGAASGETVTVDAFGDLNGGDFLTESSFKLGPMTVGTGVGPSGVPAMIDGVYSIGLRVNTGVLDITTVTSDAQTAGGLRSTVTSTIPAAVPEPATLALAGVGLAGIGFARCRELRTRRSRRRQPRSPWAFVC